MLINVAPTGGEPHRHSGNGGWKNCTSSETAWKTTSATSTRAASSISSPAFRPRSSTSASAAMGSSTSATSSSNTSNISSRVDPDEFDERRRSDEDGRRPPPGGTSGRGRFNGRSNAPPAQSKPPIQEIFRRGERSPGASHQGRDRHQGADAFDLHQHSRPLPGLMPGAAARRRQPQDRGRRRSPQTAAQHATN
jgi:hypothetical protein